MATNQFLPFGTGANADVLTYADYSALGFRSTGFGTGTAISTQLNTVWRQGAMGAHVLAQFTADSLLADVLDNGVSYLPSYKAAIRSQSLNYAAAAGTPNALTVTLSPAISVAPAAGLMLRLLIAAVNTGGVTLNAGWGAAAVVTQKGVAVAAGDLQAGAIVTVIWTGTVWVLAHLAYSEPVLGSLINIQVFAASSMYLRAPNTRSIIVEGAGGGGAGGGLPDIPAGSYGVGAGGSAGGYALARYTDVPSSVPVTIGTGGAGTYTTGGNGGSASFGSMLTVPGGMGGGNMATNASTGVFMANAGLPGAAVTGSSIIKAWSGGCSTNDALILFPGPVMIPGHGAAHPMGFGGGPGAPASAVGYGAGGGGRYGTNIAAQLGGAGAPPVIIVYEYA